MTEAVLDDLVALLPPLLQSLEALGFVARHVNPPDLADVVRVVGAPDEALRAIRPRLDAWPDQFSDVRGQVAASIDEALAGFDALREATASDVDLRAVFRALRHLPLAQEAIYPLAAKLPPVSLFFLTPELREDAALQARLAQPPAANTGVQHAGEPGRRGGFSLYVPEYYTPDRSWPLVMALHGGSGNGRAFLWSWLRDARSRGAIVIAPTAIGGTWALMGDDPDTPSLTRMLDYVRGHWNIDASRMLMTGMSDGGTFCYVSGLEPASPFTHLAPVSATFHPMLAQMADEDRLRDLPVYVTHGALDWMFPVNVAQEAAEALTMAGARVTYREIPDLPHCYPREINPDLLTWLADTPAKPPAV